MRAETFDARACVLGEGPLWHPERAQLFWFDIMRKQLLSQRDGAEKTWQFDRHVSAAGWIDAEQLLIATERGLIQFNVETGAAIHIEDLEADNPITRSNDGRADPQGGFWIGTMGKQAEQDAGAIYRFYCGELRQLFAPITIPNAICFAPTGDSAYFADTAANTVWKVGLDAKGWPQGAPEVFGDLSGEGLHPDGAVVDAAGRMWMAQWGAGRVACYGPSGDFIEEVAVPGLHASCPAFGGVDFGELYVTTARQGRGGAVTEQDGQTYRAKVSARGLAEHRVLL